MILRFFTYFGISAFFAVLQTNVLHLFVGNGTYPVPDIAFLVLVFVSFTQGAMMGQLLGFSSGLVFDFMSLSPFGFNAFVKTVTGYIIGRFKGIILLDNVFLPMVVVAIALLLRAFISLLLALFLGQISVVQRIISFDFLIEFFMTFALAPLIFWPLKGLSSILFARRTYR